MPHTEKRTRIVSTFKPATSQGKGSNDPISLSTDGSIVVNMAKLATPRNVYDADVAWAEQRAHDYVSLFFGKDNIDEPAKLRTRLEIKYGREAFIGHFWPNSSEFRATLKSGHSNPTPPEPKSRRVAEKDHSEWANFDFGAKLGSLVSLDFFLLPPSAAVRLIRGGGSSSLEMTPVLRVNLSISDLLSLYESCAPIVDKITAEEATNHGN